jgi:hypothetical protein
MTAGGLNWTTDPVELPGVDPADPPTELLEGRLWHGGCPVDFAWVRRTGIDVVLDVVDPDAYPVLDRIAELGSVAFRIWDCRRQGLDLDWLRAELGAWRTPLQQTAVGRR